jgi:hypothetical protein
MLQPLPPAIIDDRQKGSIAAKAASEYRSRLSREHPATMLLLATATQMMKKNK